MRARLREKRPQGNVIDYRDVVMDRDRHEVTRGGKPIALTAKEYALLEYLLLHRNKVHTRDELFNGVWGSDFLGRLESHRRLHPLSARQNRRRLRREADHDRARRRLHDQGLKLSLRWRIAAAYALLLVAALAATSAAIVWRFQAILYDEARSRIDATMRRS